MLAGLGFLASLGASGGAAGLPTANWRLPVLDAFDSDTTPQTAALIANTSLPQLAVAKGVTRDIAWRIPATTAKVLLWFDLGGLPGAGTPSDYAVAVQTAADAAAYPAAGAWTDVVDVHRNATWTPWAPADDSTTPVVNRAFARGQWIYVPPGPQRWLRLRLTNNDAGAVALRCNPGLFDMGVARPQIWVGASMSIFRMAMTAMEVIADIKAAIPAADPVFLTTSRSGATPGSMLTAQLQPFAAMHPNAWLYLVDPGPNNFIGPSGARPYPGAGGTAAADLSSQTAALISFLGSLGNSPKAFFAGLTYGNYGPNSPTGTDPAFNVNGTANQGFGSKPFNDNVIHPVLKGQLAATSWRFDLDVPQLDGYSGFLENFEGYISYPTIGARGGGDGVHPGTLGGPAYRRIFWPAYRAAYTGNPGPSRIEELIAFEEQGGTPIPAARKTRLQTVFDALPATTTATAARAALAARIAALRAGYADPPGWTPASLTPDLWLDAAQFDLLTVSGEGMTSAMTDRSANAWALAQTSTNTPVPRPGWVPKARNGYGVFRAPTFDGGASPSLVGTSPGLLTLADGAADLTLWFCGAAAQANLMTPLGWQNAAGQISLALGQVSGTWGMRLLVNNATVLSEATPPAASPGVLFLYVVRRAGSALQIWRQGAGSGALTAASTPSGTATVATVVQSGGTAFRLGARASGSNAWLGDWAEAGLLRRAATDAELNALFAYAAAKWRAV